MTRGHQTTEFRNKIADALATIVSENWVEQQAGTHWRGEIHSDFAVWSIFYDEIRVVLTCILRLKSQGGRTVAAQRKMREDEIEALYGLLVDTLREHGTIDPA